ncbi:MAG: [protein-PII] uridylyltransferase [Polyangiaceae bacterium]|nr:[protein-PII] uridylyltransferase [Polyangiaceae bacterium]MCW5791313.1 [protein-PII] uridylyltransferase [Polyangiaceae bacterium]
MSSAAPALLTELSPKLVAELRLYLDRHRGDVGAMIEPGGEDSGLPASRRHAQAFDGLLMSLFHAAKAALAGRGGSELSLAAVGSYGRQALALHSDLDVRLVRGENREAASQLAEALLYPLWDSGLSVGHQVVTCDELIELARADLPTATSLLDWRHLVGTPTDLTRAFAAVFGEDGLRRFISELAQGAAEREERFGDSIYLLEPEVKNGAGGLRDLDIAYWAARARWRVDSLDDLVRAGVLVTRELFPLLAARDFLWRVRNQLHFIARRRSDRLSFDAQEVLAEKFGYGAGGQGVERFMSDYYRHARAVQRGRDSLMSRALPPPSRRPRGKRLPGGLRLTGETVSLSDPAELETDPALALRVYAEAVKRDLPVYDFARDQIARAATSESFAAALRESPEAARLFVRLVKTIKRTRLRQRSVLRELHDVGLLVAMIPEFLPVVGRVHHDIYHVYTVDVHSVAAVDRLRRLMRGDLASELPLASRLAAEVSRKDVLFFATLLHDVGKDHGGKNHSERGAELAQGILTRLGLQAADIQEVRHLIAKHLRMYHVATRRDVDDPRTLSEFAQEVHGQEGLKELYLLTVVDVSTTSPTAMTSWKARMLEELYLATDRFLVEGRALRDGGATARIREEVLRHASPPGGATAERLDPARVTKLLQALPERYWFANPPDSIAEHLRFLIEVTDRDVALRLFGEDDPYLEVCVVAADRPGLLSLIAAAFAANHLKVIGAQIYSLRDTRGRPRVLDLFWVRSGTSSKAGRAAAARAERDLARLMAGEVTAEELVKRGRSPLAERPAPDVPTRVSVDNRAASNHSVVEVVTRDRPGLLFGLAAAINRNGFTIELAKINTEGVRVADVFYVTDEGGTKVTEQPRIEELKERILASISQLEREDSAP